jgi:hypothetical protein
VLGIELEAAGVKQNVKPVASCCKVNFICLRKRFDRRQQLL